MGAMDFDDVEAGSQGPPGGRGETLDDVVDLCLGKGVR